MDENDPKMNAAIAQARATIDQFVKALEAPAPSQSLFAIKAPLSDGTHVEHVWLNEVKIDGTSFRGVINNAPELVTGYKLGQPITIERGNVSDWMFVDAGRLRGGYTIRVLRDLMSPKERAESDRQMPFSID